MRMPFFSLPLEQMTRLLPKVYVKCKFINLTYLLDTAIAFFSFSSYTVLITSRQYLELEQDLRIKCLLYFTNILCIIRSCLLLFVHYRCRITFENRISHVTVFLSATVHPRFSRDPFYRRIFGTFRKRVP